jgi:hypothetical protein
MNIAWEIFLSAEDLLEIIHQVFFNNLQGIIKTTSFIRFIFFHNIHIEITISYVTAWKDSRRR